MIKFKFRKTWFLECSKQHPQPSNRIKKISCSLVYFSHPRPLCYLPFCNAGTWSTLIFSSFIQCKTQIQGWKEKQKKNLIDEYVFLFRIHMDRFCFDLIKSVFWLVDNKQRCLAINTSVRHESVLTVYSCPLNSITPISWRFSISGVKLLDIYPTRYRWTSELTSTLH